jgi:hypothetical protein
MMDTNDALQNAIDDGTTNIFGTDVCAQYATEMYLRKKKK